VDGVCLFFHYLLSIVLSIFLRRKTSDYPFGIFKLFKIIISTYFNVLAMSVFQKRVVCTKSGIYMYIFITIAYFYSCISMALG
jgi:hypothetical protein